MSVTPPAGPPATDGSPVYVRGGQTNGLAVASLVLGILWIFWLGSLLALVFGFIAKGQIERSNGAQGGKGLAIAGIVLGCVGACTLLLVILLGDFTFETSP
jgi:hypothetical protein